MSPGAVTVVGDTRLRATLAVAAERLDHLETAGQSASRLIMQAARGRAPKRTGRLAGSLSADADGTEAEVSAGAVYAGVIHYGWAAHGISANPFLVPVAESTQSVWIRSYQAEVVAAISIVKGA